MGQKELSLAKWIEKQPLPAQPVLKSLSRTLKEGMRQHPNANPLTLLDETTIDYAIGQIAERVGQVTAWNLVHATMEKAWGEDGRAYNLVPTGSLVIGPDGIATTTRSLAASGPKAPRANRRVNKVS